MILTSHILLVYLIQNTGTINRSQPWKTCICPQVIYGKRVFLWMIMFTDLYQCKMRNISSELNLTSLRKKTKTRSSTSCLAGLCWNDNTALKRSCSGHGIIPGECEPSLSTESCFTWPSTQPALLMVLTAPSTASPELVLHALHISTHTGAKEWIMSSYETCTSKKDCGQGRIWYTASIKLGA